MSRDPSRETRIPRRWLSLLWSVLLLCIVGTLCFLLYFGAFREYANEEWIKQLILHTQDAASGEWAVLSFLLVCTIRPITLFPSSILALVAGAIWGLFHGTIFALVGSVAGASLAFWLARRTGHRFIQNLVGRRADRKLEGNPRYGFGRVFWTRLVPIFPFDVVSYGAGFSSMRFHHYLAATTFGLVPSTFLYIALGNALRTNDVPAMIVSIALLLLISAYVLRGPRRRAKEKALRARTQTETPTQ